MPIYTEPVIRAPNHRGKPRLTTVLGNLPGAVGRGFDGDGIPPRRKQENGHSRVWWFKTPLDELPPGVVEITDAAYTSIDEERERTKPVPPPPRPPQRNFAAEIDALEERLATVEGR